MAKKTREKLIDVARQLFVHKGVERTTMNDIAEASEKGRRTIYTYFKNKKEIYNAVLEKESERMVGELKAIASGPAPVEERLRKVLVKRIDLGSELSGNSSSFKSLFKFDSRRMERIRKLVRDKEKMMITELLEEGMSKGKFKSDRCKLADLFLVRCFNYFDSPENDTEDSESLLISQAAWVDFIITDLVVCDNPSY